MRTPTNTRLVFLSLIFSLILSACAAPSMKPIEPYLIADNGHQLFQLETQDGVDTSFSVFVKGQCAVVEVSDAFVVLNMSVEATVFEGKSCEADTSGIKIQVVPYGVVYRYVKDGEYRYDDSEAVFDYARQLTPSQIESEVVGEIYVVE